MVDWDAKYSKRDGPLFGGAPNEFVRQLVARSDFSARSALMLADGDGRNGRFLAQVGLCVTAVDISAVATQRANGSDRAAGVEVERIAADLATWQSPEGRNYDAVFMIYLHCDAPTRTHALRQAVSRLAPGGWLVVEGFAKGQASRIGMGPSDASLLYATQDVIEAVPGCEVIEALEGWVRLAEGDAHRGKALVVRLILQKLQN